MKLPSLDHLISSLLKTVQRFPFTLAAATLGTVSAVMIAENPSEGEDLYIRLLMIASLGLPLSFAIHAFTERHSALKFKIPLWVGAIAMLAAYYISLPVRFNDANESLAYRYVAFGAAMHLITAFSAFYSFREVNGFWQFNKLMFLRFLTAVLYSGVLFLGLAGAVLAIDQLFNVHVDEKFYLHLWFLIAGIFNTVFFLGGIPKPVEQLQHETSYPKGLKIFTQYVLIPLVTVYLVILYAYMVKIIFQGTLPRGWVANLILGFSVSGTLSLLLVWPIREHEGNDWIKAFSRFFYLSLVPLIVLLFVAIGKRISDYGFTIERYIVFALGVWLSVITLYFLFSKSKNIILIPASLFAFIVVSAVGPLSMFSVSERSQLNRLQALLTDIGAFENGKAKKPASAEVNGDYYWRAAEISSILYYLERNHSLSSLKSWMPDDCSQLDSYAISDCLGIETGGQVVATPQLSYYSADNREEKGLTITGFDKFYRVFAYDANSEDNLMTTNLYQNVLKVYDSDLVVTIPLDSLSQLLYKLPANGTALPGEQLTFTVRDSQGREVRLCVNEASMEKDENTQQYIVKNLNAYLLVREK